MHFTSVAEVVVLAFSLVVIEDVNGAGRCVAGVFFVMTFLIYERVCNFEVYLWL
jgi:hypothetical protein